jgi:cytochrome c oxidase subunit 3
MPAHPSRAAALAVWMLLISDAVIFAALLGGYVLTRLDASTWSDRSHVFNLPLAWAMTALLIGASISAARAARRGSRRVFAVTALLGTIFLGMQAYEWTKLIGEGARLSGNPWGVPLFSAWFFVLTGFHGAHVLLGLIWALIVTTSRGGKLSNPTLCALYWHFVDGLWFLVFSAVYVF